MKIFIGALVVLLVLFGVYGLGVYNNLITQNEAVDTQWAQVETQYQRRFDLVPGLVEATKAVLTQEQEVFGAIAEARTRYSGAGTVNEKVQAANELESALARLLVIVENYPQLRSTETVQTFMAQYEGAENRISVERQRFNEAVQGYNLIVKRFPGSLIAGMFGFGEREFFESAEGSEEAPEVDFTL
ncbi:MAG: LemA family protein [Anaplasmataceae bacterium]|nr:LemA family protein [Anaplasmataceae bacterium]